MSFYSRNFKYIIINDLYPRVSTNADTHKDLAGRQADKVTSAGFAQLNILPNSGPDDEDVTFEVTCWGESVGLNIKSIPLADAEILRRMFSDPE